MDTVPRNCGSTADRQFSTPAHLCRASHASWSLWPTAAAAADVSAAAAATAASTAAATLATRPASIHRVHCMCTLYAYATRCRMVWDRDNLHLHPVWWQIGWFCRVSLTTSMWCISEDYVVRYMRTTCVSIPSRDWQRIRFTLCVDVQLNGSA